MLDIRFSWNCKIREVFVFLVIGFLGDFRRVNLIRLKGTASRRLWREMEGLLFWVRNEGPILDRDCLNR